MSRFTERAELLTLPVIPLRGLVAFPSIPLSFEIERKVSVAAYDKAMDTDATVMLAAQRDVFCDDPSRKDLFDVGCVARIKQSVRTPDDAVHVLVEVMCRAEIRSLTRDSDGCTWADVMTKTVTLDGEPDARIRALMNALCSSLEEQAGGRRISNEMLLTARALKNPGLLADFVAASALGNWENKQQVLEEFDPVRRLSLTLRLFEDESALFGIEEEIQERVRNSIGASQREHYLREQLRIINEELGNGDDDEYLDRIKAAKLPEEVEQKLLREVSRLGQTSFGSPEGALIRNYLDVCLALPWNAATKDRVDVDIASKILDEDHDGLRRVKDRILEYLAVKQLSPGLRHQIICLVGPPGTGKTSVAASIARAMKRKYVRVSLGGVRDEADIRGHRKTYIGAMPGRIINALTEAGVKNPLILFDEIDKLTRDAHGDPSSAMLEVLDSEQNKNFRDHFVELPFDLSDCMFICTANTTETIPRPLLDRMEVIELSSYTRSEKLSIAKNHLIPKQCRRHGIDRRRFRIRDDAVYELIDYYTAEAGVRELEREIASLCRKAARRFVAGEMKSVTLTAELIKDYLGARKMIPERISDRDETGVVNGMAYTSVGGDLLKIEALVMDGSGKIELTGSLGDVMKESANIGVSYIRAHAAELGVEREFYKTKDIHIHVPEGATPKDGPSAGITMLCAMVSALSGRPVRRDIAMTGELTLTGRVLAIGGLREKTAAAYAAGVRRILIPKDNAADLEDIDPVVRESVIFTPISHAEEALGIIFAEQHRTQKQKTVKPDPVMPEIPAHVPVTYGVSCKSQG